MSDVVPAVVSESAAPGWRLATFRALRHRNYRLYFIGQMVSLVGSWVQTTAVMWLAWELTGLSIWTGLVSAAQFVPTFLLGGWGGSLADRWPRRPLVMLTQAALLALALLLFFLTWLGQITAWQLLTVSLAAGLVNAVDMPVRLAFVMDLVGRDDLTNAIGLNSLLFNTARAVGPALSAWLLQRVTAAHCFLLNGLSFVAVLIALACMSPMPSLIVGPETDVRLRQTFSYLAERPKLVLLFVLTGAMAFFGWPVLVVLPALAEHQLTAGHVEFSSLVSAVGFGALVGALLVATVNAMAWRRVLIWTGVALTASGLFGLSRVETLFWARSYSMLVGAGLILFLATSQSVVQLSAEEHNRGRILGVYSMVLSGAVPLGNLFAGLAADAWGVSTVLTIQAAGAALAAALVLVLRVMLPTKA